jgi:hypothetical protein
MSFVTFYDILLGRREDTKTDARNSVSKCENIYACALDSNPMVII